jgi:DNA-binding transcriptional MerR regulator
MESDVVKEMAKYKIGWVAEYAGCSRSTIFSYIRQGFIEEPARNRAGHRMFKKSEAETIRRIFNLRVKV